MRSETPSTRVLGGLGNRRREGALSNRESTGTRGLGISNQEALETDQSPTGRTCVLPLASADAGNHHGSLRFRDRENRRWECKNGWRMNSRRFRIHIYRAVCFGCALAGGFFFALLLGVSTARVRRNLLHLHHGRATAQRTHDQDREKCCYDATEPVHAYSLEERDG